MYLLHCVNNSFYCGVSNNISRHIRQHNGDEIKCGAKYIHAHASCELVYQEKANNKNQAFKRKYEIKQMSRIDKLLLIKKTMKSYLQISCEDHSIYELAIMRLQSIEVLIDKSIQVIRPKNIITKSTE